MSRNFFNYADVAIDYSLNGRVEATGGNPLRLFEKEVTKKGEKVIGHDWSMVVSLVERGYDPADRLPIVYRMASWQDGDTPINVEENRSAVMDAILSGPECKVTVEIEPGKPQTVVATAAEMAQEFKRLTAGNRSPEWVLGAGFRRSFGVVPANVIRRKLELPEIGGFEADVKTFDSEAERITACAKENTQVGMGQRKLNSLDFLLLARQLYRVGVNTEAKIRKALDLKRGEAQRCFCLTVLDADYPRLSLIDKVVSEEVPLSSLDKEHLRKELLTSFKAADGSILDPDERQKLIDEKEEDVAAYFGDPSNRKRPKKPSSAKKLAEKLKGSPLMQDKAVHTAIENGDLESYFQKHHKHAEQLNATRSAVLNGVVFPLDEKGKMLPWPSDPETGEPITQAQLDTLISRLKSVEAENAKLRKAAGSKATKKAR